MRIESYGPQAFQPAAAMRNAAGTPPVNSTAETEATSPQEKLRRLLDEKRALTQSAFEPQAEATLGQHIDLRV